MKKKLEFDNLVEQLMQYWNNNDLMRENNSTWLAHCFVSIICARLLFPKILEKLTHIN